jgi:hypothetical protein
MWFARAGFPPGTRAKNALLASNPAQRLGAFFFVDLLIAGKNAAPD